MTPIPIILLLLPTCLLSFTCTSCPFKLETSASCSDTCQGDICFIVVNKYFNGTVIAGCLSAGNNDSVHNGTSVCHRKEEHTICACTSFDNCNNPRASLSTFEFTEHEILEGQQIFPQIQPTESPVVLVNESTESEVEASGNIQGSFQLDNTSSSVVEKEGMPINNETSGNNEAMRLNTTTLEETIDQPSSMAYDIQCLFAVFCLLLS